tara:strand:- start:41225 stop:41686 length:462 start_codon:yes stop_codon:yes gene_type:complete
MTVHDMHLEISTNIKASPHDVYSLVSDLARMGEWSTENIGGEWVSGNPGQVGSRFLGNNRIKTFEWSVPVEITIANPGECFEFVAAPDDGPFVRWTFRMAEVQSGTELTEIWDVMALPPSLAKFDAEGLAARKVAVQGTIEATLEGIRVSAEQ